jgi:hypothetical protein
MLMLCHCTRAGGTPRHQIDWNNWLTKCLEDGAAWHPEGETGVLRGGGLLTPIDSGVLSSLSDEEVGFSAVHILRGVLYVNLPCF